VANTSIARAGLLNPLAHLRSITADELSHSQLKANTLQFFRLFLALKIAIPFAFPNGIYWPLSIKALVILFIILTVSLRRYYHVGMWAICALAFYKFLNFWPFTINHNGLELGIALLMCLMPDEELNPKQVSCIELIKILMMSVWFFSGIHKLVDGYYWNAEYFALEALANTTPLGHHLNNILSFFGPFSFADGQNSFSCCREGMIEFSPWQMVILLTLSWSTIVVEILLPLSVLIVRFRSCGIVGLVIFQCFVSYFSGEIDFAFTAFATIFLFIPQFARFTYPSLAFLFLLVQPWT
jgi:hypothetical protein